MLDCIAAVEIIALADVERVVCRMRLVTCVIVKIDTAPSVEGAVLNIQNAAVGVAVHGKPIGPTVKGAVRNGDVHMLLRIRGGSCEYQPLEGVVTGCEVDTADRQSRISSFINSRKLVFHSPDHGGLVLTGAFQIDPPFDGQKLIGKLISPRSELDGITVIGRSKIALKIGGGSNDDFALAGGIAAHGRIIQSLIFEIIGIVPDTLIIAVKVVRIVTRLSEHLNGIIAPCSVNILCKNGIANLDGHGTEGVGEYGVADIQSVAGSAGIDADGVFPAVENTTFNI